MSQEIIAEMVGTTRSRVNGLLAKFRKLGFIERDGHVLRVRPSLQRAFYRTSGRERRAS
jgi:DNA-binding IclR family transcriptional regulator